VPGHLDQEGSVVQQDPATQVGEAFRHDRLLWRIQSDVTAVSNNSSHDITTGLSNVRTPSHIHSRYYMRPTLSAQASFTNRRKLANFLGGRLPF
jgi:hypothetical protein